MSYPENRKGDTCPNCGRQSWRVVGELFACPECFWQEKAPRGLVFKQDYLSKCIEDVVKFDTDHGVEREHAPGIDNMVYHALCLTGEAGEIANVIKKIWRDGDSAQLRTHLAEEMVDLMIFMSLLCKSAEIDFDKAWREKHEELYRRWADKQISRRKTHIIHIDSKHAVVELADHDCSNCTLPSEVAR